jgi:hypothetical protein
MILGLAINMGDNHRTGAIIKRMVGEILKVNFDPSSRSGVSEETVWIAGCKARLIRVKNPDANLRALTFSDRGTMFLELVGGEKTSQADELLDAVKKGFRLLD